MRYCNLEYISIGLLGAMFGSFLTMLSYRLPQKIDVVIKRSFCTKCKHVLGFFDLLPIFSWIMNRGKCRYCFQSVSCRYILIEVISAFLACLIYKKFGITAIGCLYFAINLILVVIIVTDLEHFIIPDSMQLLLVIFAISLFFIDHRSFYEVLLSTGLSLAISLLMKYGCLIIKKQDGLGWGDVKFITITGLFINIKSLPMFFLLSGIFGIVTAIIWRHLGKGLVFPFAPALALSLAFCLFFPEIAVNIEDYIVAHIPFFIKFQGS